MKISVTDFSAPTKASVFKFCVHLDVGKVYCVNENEDANPCRGTRRICYLL